MRRSISKEGGFTISCSKENWKNFMFMQLLKLRMLFSKGLEQGCNNSLDPIEQLYRLHNLQGEEVKARVDLKENGRQLV